MGEGGAEGGGGGLRVGWGRERAEHEDRLGREGAEGRLGEGGLRVGWGEGARLGEGGG